MNDRNRELKPFVPQPDDDMIVCRCEEITKGRSGVLCMTVCLPSPRYAAICGRVWDSARGRPVQNW